MNKTKKTIHELMADRLSRAEGQIHALKEMLENKSTDCAKFITQIKAVRSALKSVSQEYVIEHLHTCQEFSKKKRDEEIRDAIRLLSRD